MVPEGAADAGPVEPERSAVPLAVRPCLPHSLPRHHRAGNKVKRHHFGKTLPRPSRHDCSRGNWQAMVVTLCSLGHLWYEIDEQYEHVIFFMMPPTVTRAKGNMQRPAYLVSIGQDAKTDNQPKKNRAELYNAIKGKKERTKK